MGTQSLEASISTLLAGVSRSANAALRASPEQGEPRDRIRAVAIGLLMMLPMIGCVSYKPPPVSPSEPTYVVGSPDELLVTVLPDPVIERSATVRPDGFISVELVGDVLAAGRTTMEISQDIQKRISRYKRNASVTVSVAASRSIQVTIYGEVGAQGTFPLTNMTRVSEAIGLRGGPLPFAAKNRVRIVRTNGETTEVFKIRLSNIMSGDLSTNIVVRGGDLIIVPPTYIAQFGYYLQMLLFPFQPFMGAGMAVATGQLIN